MSRIEFYLVFGGRSAEHPVSLSSANSILHHINREKYNITTIGIDKDGQWLYFENAPFENPDETAKICLSKTGRPVVFRPHHEHCFSIVENNQLKPLAKPDVVFPILHGPYGEDGTIQGLFAMLNVRYVGAGVLASAAGMDKVLSKKMIENAGLPVTPYAVLHSNDLNDLKSQYQNLSKKLGTDIFVKPANMGSSIGISHVTNLEAFKAAVDLACQYDCKLLVEKTVRGREFSCGVLGNEQPKAALPGELVYSHDFFTYDAKYIDDSVKVVVPANIDDGLQKQMQQIAVDAFKLLGVRGMARIDFLYDASAKQIYFNEINTLPGFTSHSQYPKQWQATGIAYPDLIDRLVELAMS